MREKRKSKRRHLIYYLKVFDSVENRLLGHLVDITTKGIQLICEAPIEVNKNYSLKMLLPKEMMEEEQMDFEAFCLWCRRDVNPEFFAVGFEMRELSSQSIELIKGLIAYFGFQDNG